MIQSNYPTEYVLMKYRHIVSSDKSDKAYRDLMMKMEEIPALHFVCRTRSDEITRQIASVSAAYTIERSFQYSLRVLDLATSNPLDAPTHLAGHLEHETYSPEAIHLPSSKSGDALTQLGYCGNPENVMQYAHEDNICVRDTRSDSYLSWLLSCFKA